MNTARRGVISLIAVSLDQLLYQMLNAPGDDLVLQYYEVFNELTHR
jgi:hypothetical protein